MIVRPGGPPDAAALAELRDIPADQQPAFADWIATHTETHLPFVAELDGHVVGCAWLHIAERVPAPGAPNRRHGDIQSVMVREQHRGQSIGAVLIAAILAEARTRALLHVTVHSGRRAVGFYERSGFTHHRQLLLWEPPTP